ncbi:MAG TPA: hypothetical protein VM012_12915, partial [Flavitalea sp.]|nr:hypothetical protein [Flavitalea sp.]
KNNSSINNIQVNTEPSAQPSIAPGLQPQPLTDLPQSESGGFVLKPGFYETEFKTYCLQPGTPDPRQGDEYLPMPITGYRKDIVQSILLNSRNRHDIEQKNIQLLLWSVVSGSNFNSLTYQVQDDAAKLLTPKQIFELKGGVVGAIKTFSTATGILNANNDIKRLFESGIHSYEAYERIAVLREQSQLMKKEVKREQWYKQSENYYVRYFPESYQKVKIQVYVPEGSLDADNQLNHEYVVFDPTGKQAIPAFTNAQRLGIGSTVLDIVRIIIKTNKRTSPPPPPKSPPKPGQNKNPKS